jgi:hypothetical protein
VQKNFDTVNSRCRTRFSRVNAPCNNDRRIRAGNRSKNFGIKEMLVLSALLLRGVFRPQNCAERKNFRVAESFAMNVSAHSR